MPIIPYFIAHVVLPDLIVKKNLPFYTFYLVNQNFDINLAMGWIKGSKATAIIAFTPV